MTKTITNLLLMLITILAGIYFYVNYCSSCGIPEKEEPIKEEVIVTTITETTSYPFAFSHGAFAYNEADNYNYIVSTSTFITPISEKVTKGIDSLKTFLLENEDKVINLTGYYKSDEANNTAYPDLGLARANDVKNHFIENGILSVQINTMSQLMDEMVPKDNIHLGPIGYSIDIKAVDADDELNALYEKIKADPIVLYFNKAQTNITLSESQRQKIADISRYLDKVEDATVIVVGHTDNTGITKANITIGQRRADFAKDYLMNNGISAAKIIASSKGQTDPIESNATEEGRAKNRRTVITLK